MAKQRAEAAREGEEKPFGGSAVIGGSAVNEANRQLRRQGNPASAGTDPLTNHMLDLLKEYIDKIAAVST